jgi:hypothetical protein
MGNVTTRDAAKFQIETGRIESKKHLIGSWFFGIFLIITGCAMIYFSFKPTSQLNCYNNDDEMAVNNACSPLNTDEDKDTKCQNAKDLLDKKNQMCNVKKPNRKLLFGGLFIPLGIFIIMYARWSDKMVQTNDSEAIKVATRNEFELFGLTKRYDVL